MVNNSYFTEVRDKGIPKMSEDSIEYEAWWKEQINRCIYGYSVGDVTIPGRLYFYVNFFKIEMDAKLKNGSYIKKLGNPFLRDIDWEIFMNFERAESEQKGFMLITGRGAGKSYAGAAIVAHAYTFFPNSQSVISGAFQQDIDLLAQKTKVGLDNLPFALKKQRLKDDWKDTVIAGYKIKDTKTSTWQTKGSLSQIIMRNFDDGRNTMAVNGTRPKVHVFEEIGKQKTLIRNYSDSAHCWMMGGRQFSIPFLMGTGGDMEKAKDAREMFYNPEAYNLIAFENTYEKHEGKIAFFISATKCMNDFKEVGGDGVTLITNEESAKTYLLTERERKRAGDKEAYNKELMYRPLVPSEAFLTTGSNIFDAVKIQEQLNYVMFNKKVLNSVGKYRLEWKEKFGEVSAIPESTGTFLIYEHPISESKGIFGAYIAGTDPYAQDTGGKNSSQGSTFIYKTMLSNTTPFEVIVAEYTDRPDRMDDYHEGVAKLLLYYNATTLYENQILGLKQYFEHNNILYLLARQPNILKDIMPDGKVNRTYGIHASPKIREYSEYLIRDYVKEHCGLKSKDENGENAVYGNLVFVDLLVELQNYNQVDNFDRVIAFGLCLIYREEIAKMLKAKYNERQSTESIGFYKTINGKLVYVKAPLVGESMLDRTRHSKMEKELQASELQFVRHAIQMNLDFAYISQVYNLPLEVIQNVAKELGRYDAPTTPNR